MNDSKCRILSVFCVFAPGAPTSDWYEDEGLRSINSTEGRVDVQLKDEILTVSNRSTGLSWEVGLKRVVGDTNNDCGVDFRDFRDLANNWLEGT